MNWKETELSYRKAAIQNATSVGLVIILYDMLVADLQRAIEAIQQSDIEKRSAEIKHAFLVLQQLEGSLQMEKGGQAAKHLSFFYSVLRSKILEAHLKISAETLQRQIELILDVRQAWEQVNVPEDQAASVAEQESSAAGLMTTIVTQAMEETSTSSSWSA